MKLRIVKARTATPGEFRAVAEKINAQEAGIQDAFAKLAAKRRRKNLRVVGR